MRSIIHRELFSGLVRMHVLHHAANRPVFGTWLIEELREHGYKVGPGTLYPILHAMEELGYLRSKSVVVNGKYRRLYEITASGKRILQHGKVKVRELCDELFEEHHDDASRPERKPRR